MSNRTLFIVKPDAVERNLTGRILAHVEEAGFRLVAGRLATLEKKQAEVFYAEHKERPFFAELVAYMTVGVDRCPRQNAPKYYCFFTVGTMLRAIH
jgi:nucleoside-diphosphate kinase